MVDYNYLVNAIGGSLPMFYIFKGYRIKEDYIKHCRGGTCMAMQRKPWMTSFLFKKFISFFNRSI